KPTSSPSRSSSSEIACRVRLIILIELMSERVWLNMPAERHDAPVAISLRSSSNTSDTPARVRCQAAEAPSRPPPTITTSASSTGVFGESISCASENPLAFRIRHFHPQDPGERRRDIPHIHNSQRPALLQRGPGDDEGGMHFRHVVELPMDSTELAVARLDQSGPGLTANHVARLEVGEERDHRWRTALAQLLGADDAPDAQFRLPLQIREQAGNPVAQRRVIRAGQDH